MGRSKGRIIDFSNEEIWRNCYIFGGKNAVRGFMIEWIGWGHTSVHGSSVCHLVPFGDYDVKKSKRCSLMVPGGNICMLSRNSCSVGDKKFIGALQKLVLSTTSVRCALGSTYPACQQLHDIWSLLCYDALNHIMKEACAGDFHVYPKFQLAWMLHICCGTLCTTSKVVTYCGY